MRSCSCRHGEVLRRKSRSSKLDQRNVRLEFDENRAGKSASQNQCITDAESDNCSLLSSGYLPGTEGFCLNFAITYWLVVVSCSPFRIFRCSTSSPYMSCCIYSRTASFLSSEVCIHNNSFTCLQTSTGAVACQLLDALSMGSINLAKVPCRALALSFDLATV